MKVVKKIDYLRGAEDAACRLARAADFFWLDANGAGGSTPMRSYLGCDAAITRESSGRSYEALEGIEVDPDGGEFADAPRWVGYLGYDENRRDAGGTMPSALFRRYDAAIVVDSNGASIVADDDGAAARLEARLRAEPIEASCVIRAQETVARREHEAAIVKALDHIAAGDIYQVNLARRWTARLEGDPLALFLKMRAASPVPLGAFLRTAAGDVLCRSMETYLDYEGPRTRVLRCRPIKGTIARAGDDAGEAERLTADPKEHAEHVMIVDLIRNDLGRVARIGSVEVEELLRVEPYAKLSHLVSTVKCVMRDDATLAEMVRETFPPGSVTGVPKLRAMRIIDELEPFAREVYTGAIGMVRRDGGALLNVAIRTAIACDGALHYYAGGGIVDASVPEREVEETELKARVFFDAAGVDGSDFADE